MLFRQSDFSSLSSLAQSVSFRTPCAVRLVSHHTLCFVKNGEGDLVVMDIETFNRREKMLKLREELLAVEEDRMAGRSGCTVDELDAYLEDVIAEV